MSTKVVPQQSMAGMNHPGAAIYHSQTRPPATRRTEDQGSAVMAEGARKRAQTDVPTHARQVSIPVSTANNNNPEPQSNFTSRRRQSIRDQKGIPGVPPVQADFSPTKRTSYRNPTNLTSSTTLTTPSIRPVPHPRQSSSTTIAGFDFGSSSRDTPKTENPSTRSTSFLPEIDRNDLRLSLGLGGDISHGFFESTVPKDVPTQSTTRIRVSPQLDALRERKYGDAGSETRISRSNSLLQRQNSDRTQKNPSMMIDNTMGPPIAASSARARRQSHFPTTKSSIAAVGRPPRKSIGPGILAVSSTSDAMELKDMPSRARLDLERETSHETRMQAFRQELAPPNPAFEAANRTSHTVNARNAKAKSMQPPLPKDYLSLPSSAFDPEWPMPNGASRTPRTNEHRTITPSSGSSKRLSMMPSHATGLGARTISPTDARRMKRMSLMPNPPPLPFTPTTPQREASSLGIRSAAQSPSLIPRKSLTPSSNRTTPDLNRKSYSSGISISSNTSYNSVRTSTGSIRIPQSLSHSRLPTVKNRVESISVPLAEDVPPVPAIPKAYESPKYEFDMPFYTSSRKSSLPFETASLNSNSTGDYVSIQSIEKEPPKETRLRLGDTPNDEAVKESRGVNVPNNSKTLQPLRLPPINLLPLSTPTEARIASFHDANGSSLGPMTPPPKRGRMRTPSTPMTASKANFFSRQQEKEEASPAPVAIRSSSSHYALRSDASSNRAPSNSSSSTWGVPDARVGRKAISPFVSSSLPRSSSDYTSTGTPYVGLDGKSAKLTGPRALNTSKLSKNDISVPTLGGQSDNANGSFGASIRRTLSLSRRKTASRASMAGEQEVEIPPPTPKHDSMPPPKLPASATWTGPWPTTNGGQKSSFLHSRRKPLDTESGTNLERVQSEIFTSGTSSDKDVIPLSDYPVKSALAKPGDAKGAGALRTFAFGGSSNSLRPTGVDTKLDRDDLVAEEEMKRMAMRRKDTEVAARELDELRKRAVPRDRVSPQQALRSANLNIFERGEIVDFKEVYFCGTQNALKFTGDLEAENANFGYDDERGDYNIVKGDHLSYRYEIVDVLGKGSFGQVVRCVDHKTGGLVAIKIIRNKRRFHQQALVEVNILQNLRDWDPHNKYSMVNFTQSFYFRGHLCISTELLGMNLYEFIKVNDFRGFSLKLIRRFTKQLLNSLVLLKSHKVIHCDLKPENILLAHPAHSEIKVIDFGSSCLENEKVYTYIQSRFYRSPEVILGMTYGMPIDMWSLGCILAELYTGCPIFPGENEQEQLACIMEVFGPPDKHLIEKSTRKKLFFDSLGKPRLTVSSKGKRRRPSSKTLQQALKCDDEAFLDFICRCLRWDPERRLKADEAIHHEYITGMKQSSSRATRNLPVSSNNVNSSSPIKRYNSITTPSMAVRPLPEPPSTAIRNGPGTKGRDPQNSGSPNKQPPPKRHSTMNGLQNGMSIKRIATGTALPNNSSLPRPGGSGTPRNGGGKSDLAAVAAAIATNVRSSTFLK
ncbi:MAG: hypothetical protein MMC33_006957 [Icmadophila ericetorum]|nr:hypothetical protein [Icmadophila ericetorum]